LLNATFGNAVEMIVRSFPHYMLSPPMKTNFRCRLAPLRS
jgi:hypothetical protein